MKIISWSTAKSLGLVRFFTGKPCPYGHIVERTTSNGTCLECSRLRRAIWHEKEREQQGRTKKWSRNVDDHIYRDRARNKGFDRYFTGMPCTKGHISSRYVSSGGCITCSAERSAIDIVINKSRRQKATKKWKDKNKDKVAESAREYRIKNKSKISARMKKWRFKNKERIELYSAEYKFKNRDIINARQNEKRSILALDKLSHRMAKIRRSENGDTI